MIFDSLGREIEGKLREYYYSYVIRRNFRHTIYPSITFSNDEHSEILQASDLIALSLNSAIFRKVERNNMSLHGLNVETLPSENQYLEIYWPLFEKNIVNNNVEGWGVKIWK